MKMISLKLIYVLDGVAVLNNTHRSISTYEPLNFYLTSKLYAEPLKKKKRIDPAIIKAREEKRKKRIEKQIRRLEKNARQPKPIEECEIPMEIINEKSVRTRITPALSEEVLNERVFITKKWSAFKHKQYLKDIQMLDRIMHSQQWALDELRNESLELYNAAIQVDPLLVPFKATGPVETPPIDSFDSPDGEYIDISKKWD